MKLFSKATDRSVWIIFLLLTLISKVYSQNTPPSFTSVPLDSIGNNATYSFAIEATDADGDTLTITALTLPDWLTLTISDSVTTYAGTGEYGHIDGPVDQARFGYPAGVAVDQAGNVYIADQDNHKIRKIDTNGMVFTLAGTGSRGYTDGPADQARFDNPAGVAVDQAGNVYVADHNNHRIRKIDTNGMVSTLAGTGDSGHADGPADQARLHYPAGVAVDQAGNVYVADQDNHKIRKIDTNGMVSTLAGTGNSGHADGPTDQARFGYPAGVAVDQAGNVYVADVGNNRIRKIDTNGMVSTLAGTGNYGYADGPVDQARFFIPIGVAVDQAGNVYVADHNNHRIRKIDTNGMVSTLAGTGDSGHADGPVDQARFDNPVGVAVDQAGNVYVAGGYNYRIRKIDLTKIWGSTIGQPPGNHLVELLVTDNDRGNDTLSYTITITDAAPSVIITGDSTSVTNTSFSATITFSETVTGLIPGDIQINGGTLDSLTTTDSKVFMAYIHPNTPGRVTVNIPEGAVTDVSGNGNTATIPYSIEYDPEAPFIESIARLSPGLESHKLDSVVFRVTFNEPVTNVGATDFQLDGSVNATAAMITDVVNVEASLAFSVFDIAVTGYTGTGTLTLGIDPTHDIEDMIGNVFADSVAHSESYTIRENAPPEFVTNSIIDTVDNNSSYYLALEVTDLDQTDELTITALTLPSWLTLTISDSVSTLAGTGNYGYADGPADQARFSYPAGVAVNQAGNVYVADQYNHRIRKIDTNGMVSTLAGTGSRGYTDGPTDQARFDNPVGVAVDQAGNVYVTDHNNHRVRKIDTNGIVSTLAGTGNYGYADGPADQARFSYLAGVAVDQEGNVYVADRYNHRIRKIDTNGMVSTLAGTGDSGHADGSADQARFSYPFGVAADQEGNLYVTDRSNHRIRKIDINGMVSTLAGTGSRGYTDGPAGQARFDYPTGVAVNQAGNLYVADRSNHRIRKIDANGMVSTLAGTGNYGYADGPADQARFSYPFGVATDQEENIYVADIGNNRIRKSLLVRSQEVR